MIRRPECSENNPQCVKNTLSFQLFLIVFFINLNTALALLVFTGEAYWGPVQPAEYFLVIVRAMFLFSFKAYKAQASFFGFQ